MLHRPSFLRFRFRCRDCKKTAWSLKFMIPMTSKPRNFSTTNIGFCPATKMAKILSETNGKRVKRHRRPTSRCSSHCIASMGKSRIVFWLLRQKPLRRSLDVQNYGEGLATE